MAAPGRPARCSNLDCDTGPAHRMTLFRIFHWLNYSRNTRDHAAASSRDPARRRQHDRQRSRMVSHYPHPLARPLKPLLRLGILSNSSNTLLCLESHWPCLDCNIASRSVRPPCPALGLAPMSTIHAPSSIECMRLCAAVICAARPSASLLSSLPAL